MRRFLSALLLLCLGILSLQATPMRLCVLPQDLADHHATRVDDSCCGGCSSDTRLLAGHEDHEDCCIDLQALPETTTSLPLELRAAPVRLLCFVETFLLPPPAPSRTELASSSFPPPKSLTAAKRQATLSIWTV